MKSYENLTAKTTHLTFELTSYNIYIDIKIIFYIKFNIKENILSVMPTISPFVFDGNLLRTPSLHPPFDIKWKGKNHADKINPLVEINTVSMIY